MIFRPITMLGYEFAEGEADFKAPEFEALEERV